MAITFWYSEDGGGLEQILVIPHDETGKMLRQLLVESAAKLESQQPKLVIVEAVRPEYQKFVDAGIAKPLEPGKIFLNAAQASRQIGFCKRGDNPVAQALAKAMKRPTPARSVQVRGVVFRWV